MRSTSNKSLPCSHDAGTALGAGEDTLEHQADARPALLQLARLLGSAAQLTSWPSRCGLLSYLSASASVESFPQLSCLHGPHSATGIFFILQGLVHKLTTVGSQPDCPVGSILHPSEPVTLQALCASLGTRIPLDHGLLVGQFSHQNISL